MKNYNVIELENKDNIAYLNRDGNKIVTTWGQYTTNIRNVVDAYLELKQENELLEAQVVAQDVQAELEELRAQVAELQLRVETQNKKLRTKQLQINAMEQEKIMYRRAISSRDIEIRSLENKVQQCQKEVWF